MICLLRLGYASELSTAGMQGAFDTAIPPPVYCICIATAPTLPPYGGLSARIGAVVFCLDHFGQVLTSISQCEMIERQRVACGLSVRERATAPQTMSASCSKLSV